MDHCVLCVCVVGVVGLRFMGVGYVWVWRVVHEVCDGYVMCIQQFATKSPCYQLAQTMLTRNILPRPNQENIT